MITKKGCLILRHPCFSQSRFGTIGSKWLYILYPLYHIHSHCTLKRLNIWRRSATSNCHFPSCTQNIINQSSYYFKKVLSLMENLSSNQIRGTFIRFLYRRNQYDRYAFVSVLRNDRPWQTSPKKR